MRDDPERLVGKLDRIGVERLAGVEGLPPILAARVAEVVVAADLPEDRRGEVFRELVDHFLSGLGSGKSPEALLVAFGDTRRAAAGIQSAKRVLTPASMGGSGTGDGLVRRIGQDLRYAARRLLARPGFTATAVLSLALGIGANTALFTVVNEVVFRGLPFERPAELVEVYRSSPDLPFGPLSNPEVAELGRRTDVFAAVVGTMFFFASRRDQERPERLTVQLVTNNYFQALGLKAGRGRLIEPADSPAPGTGSVVVLSDRYWRRAFGASQAVLGQPLKLPGGDYTILGVMRPDFDGAFRGIATDIYIPINRFNQLAARSQDELTSWVNHSNFVRARLKPGVSVAQASAAVGALAADLRSRRVGGWEGPIAFRLIPTTQVIVYPPIDQILTPMVGMLAVVVGLVLIIACANLAGFLLARAVDRRKEIAVRLSLGATRGRLVSQLLIETVLLAGVGGLVGVGLGKLALQLVLAADLPLPVAVTLDLPLDGRVLAFSLGVSIFAGVLAGLAPALKATSLELASVIRDESTGGGRGKSALRGVLVSGQVAVAVVLLVVAGLFVRSLSAARNLDPGFGHAEMALVSTAAPGTMSMALAEQTFGRLRQRLLEMPGVVAVGLGDNIHLNPLNQSDIDVVVDNVPPPAGEESHTVDRADIDTGFVAAIGLKLRKGRNFTIADGDSSRRVAIVNEAFVAKFFPGKDGVGSRFRDRAGTETEIVGVVNTAKIRSLAEPPTPFVYRPLRGYSGVIFVVRANRPAVATLAATMRTLRDVAPDLMVLESKTMARHLATMSLPIKLGANALAAFALLALVMASIGLYGSVSYAVSQRSREVGIRLSLGADRRSVIWLLLSGGLRLVGIGAAVGMVFGVAFGKLLEGQLFGVRAVDPVTLVAVPLVLVLVAAVAAYLPARRAGTIDPLAALKAE